MGTHCVAGNILTGCCGGHRSDPDALVHLDEAAELFGVIALERQILGTFLSKSSFKTDSKGNCHLKRSLAYDFGRIVW